MEKRVTRGAGKKDNNNKNNKNDDNNNNTKKESPTKKAAMKRAGTMAETAEDGESFLKDQGYKQGKGEGNS